jgi:phosphopantothenoylcysteine decarboxylase / phosphopantothenate---cysteine ligase
MNYNNLLKNRRIGLAVTASVSIYKALELVRLYTKAGAEVRVVMSEEAKKFVAPIMFEALTGHAVLHSGTESWTNEDNHIGLAKWVEVFVVAPASANTIAKLANAIADNLMLQTLLASTAPKVLAPAANTAMIEHPITKANIKMLTLCGYEVVDSVSKLLACGDEGKGGLAEVEDIFLASARALLREEFWEYRNAVVTGGGTMERIDDVRYIGNFSSGKMADALAVALYVRGADVRLVSSKSSLGLAVIKTIEFEGGEELFAKLGALLDGAKMPKSTKPTLLSSEPVRPVSKEPYLFMAAAVGDFAPAKKQSGKLKKEGKDTLTLELAKTVDIVANLKKDGLKTVAFKAEMDTANAASSAKKALKAKGVDAVCLNVLGGEINFGSDENEVVFVGKNGETKIAKADKLTVALQILENAKKL